MRTRLQKSHQWGRFWWFWSFLSKCGDQFLKRWRFIYILFLTNSVMLELLNLACIQFMDWGVNLLIWKIFPDLLLGCIFSCLHTVGNLSHFYVLSWEKSSASINEWLSFIFLFQDCPYFLIWSNVYMVNVYKVLKHKFYNLLDYWVLYLLIHED